MTAVKLDPTAVTFIDKIDKKVIEYLKQNEPILGNFIDAYEKGKIVQ